jgi:hypothetical protein
MNMRSWRCFDGTELQKFWGRSAASRDNPCDDDSKKKPKGPETTSHRPYVEEYVDH